METAQKVTGFEYYGIAAGCDLARSYLWDFCQIIAPEFYTNEKHHLKLLCDTLQSIYDGTLLKNDGTPYRRLIINYPPRHGKTRTLVNFTSWVLGHDNTERIIACSYNDDEATDFSKYTRNTIMEEKVDSGIVYSDIFPETQIKQGDASYKKWALNGQFFNYKGSGLGGSLTGKGGTVLIIDDPVKDAEIAFNEIALDKIWKWYTGTFLSRKEEGAIEIVNHTRWASKDPCGRILDGKNSDDWFVLQAEAFDGESMLCDSIFSKRSYDDLLAEMDENIFMANYHQKPIDMKGRLYKNLKLYREIPVDSTGEPLFTKIINYTDTADEGKDFLCSVCAGVINKELYILDVLYTQDGMEITEPATADLLIENYVSESKVESNNGGRGFARKVIDLVKGYGKSINIVWYHNTKNKIARILTKSNYIMKHVYFPYNWHERWPQFYVAINTYQKEGKNKHDDGPDALTGLAEMVDGAFEFTRHERVL